MRQEYTATITSMEQLTETAFDMTFFLKQRVEARPGQFISIKCGDANLLRRPLSIADCGDFSFRAVFDVRGKGTSWLSSRRVGDEVSVLGPLGNGFSDKALSAQNVLLVGGGIGVPPMCFASKRLNGHIDAVLGYRTIDAVILDEEMQMDTDELIVCTDDGTFGRHGFVSDAAKEILTRKSYDCILACGPLPMLKSVAALAGKHGIGCEVSMEQRMGCTIGACLVCAVPVRTPDGIEYRHVCKDGPVFNAEEVFFDD